MTKMETLAPVRLNDEALRVLFEMWRQVDDLREQDSEAADKVEAVLTAQPGFDAQLTLMLAADANQLDAVQDALSKGADPNWETEFDCEGIGTEFFNGCSAMVLATDLEVLAACKAAGGDVNARVTGARGYSVLCDTLRWPRQDAETYLQKAEWLIRQGADLTDIGNGSASVLYWLMIEKGHREPEDPWVLDAVKLVLRHGAVLRDDEERELAERYFERPEFAALKTAYDDAMAAASVAE